MSLTDLVNLNTNLIRQAINFQTTEEPNPLLEDTGEGTEEGGVIVVTDGDEEPEPDEFKGFSSTDKFEFERVVSWLTENVYGGQTEGQTTIMDAFINEWAVRWRLKNGWRANDQINVVPSLDDLLNDPEFLTGASYLPFRTALDSSLPPVFRTTVPNEEGIEVEVVVLNDPLTGPRFIESTFEPEREPIREVEGGTQRVIRNPFARRSRVTATPSETGGAPILEDEPPEPVSGGAATPSEARGTVVTGTTGGTPSTVATPSEMRGVPIGPLVPPDLLDEILSGIGDDGGGSRGGGGGGGGGTKRDIVFDKAQLIEQVDKLWKNWFRSAPGEGKVEGMVDQYIREARGFWNLDGGQLDFDTFIRTKLRKQPIYQVRFRHKPAATNEETFVATFEQPITQLGIRPDLVEKHTIAAMQSGASPSEQLKRVGRTREVQIQGGFSQRLAQTINNLGGGARS